MTINEQENYINFVNKVKFKYGVDARRWLISTYTNEEIENNIIRAIEDYMVNIEGNYDNI